MFWAGSILFSAVVFFWGVSLQAAVNYNAAAEAQWSELRQLRRASQVVRLEDRFPSQERIPNLKYSLEEFAGSDGLQMKRFEIDSKKWEGSLQTIDFTLWLDVPSTDKARVEAWVRSWPGRHMRWVELRDAKSIEYIKDEGFRVKARAFRLQDPTASDLKARIEQERDKLQFYWSKVFPGQAFQPETVVSSKR